MSNINWHNKRQVWQVQKQTSDDARDNSSKDDFDFFYKRGYWPLKGKHKGTPIKLLNLTYLEWVVNNLKGKIKQIARQELTRRQIETKQKITSLRKK